MVRNDVTFPIGDDMQVAGCELPRWRGGGRYICKALPQGSRAYVYQIDLLLLQAIILPLFVYICPLFPGPPPPP